MVQGSLGLAPNLEKVKERELVRKRKKNKSSVVALAGWGRSAVILAVHNNLYRG